MNIKVQKLAVPVAIVIEEAKEETQKRLDKEWEKIKDNVVIPGFRKGNVDREIAERKIGFKKLYDSVIKEIIEEGLSKGETKDVEIINEMQVINFDINKDTLLQLIVDVRPKVILKKYKEGIELPKIEAKVTNEEIFEYLKSLQEKQATVTQVDREAKKGDIVVIEYKEKIKNEEKEDISKKIEKKEIIIGSNQFFSEFEEQLIGVKVDGLVKTISVNFKKEDQNFIGKEINFLVKVISVKERVLSKIDDDFAKSNSFESLDKWKEEIMKELLKKKEIGKQNKERQLIMNELIKNNDVDPIPDSLIIRELNFLLYKQAAIFGLSEKDFLKKFKVDRSNFDKIHINSVIEQWKGRVILETIFKQEGLKVSVEEVNKRIEQISEKEKIRKEEIVRDKIIRQLGKEKAYEFIKSLCKIKKEEKKQ